MAGYQPALRGRSHGADGIEQALAGRRDLVDGGVEGFLVGSRRFLITADFTDELQSGCTQLIRSRGLAWSTQDFDGSAHRFYGTSR